MRLITRALALESRFFDSILSGNAAHAVAETELDLQKMHELESHETLLDALDQWILMPDKRLYPQLIELGALVRKVYHFPATMMVYRGFDLQSPYQNTMGLATKGLLFNHEKPLRVGEHHRYEGDTPISCTTDPDIAKAFGKTVIRAKIQPNRPGSLVITPELCALVCKKRNIDLQTQKEVILLPPVNLQFEIHAQR